MSKTGTQFGPEPYQYDPYDNLTDGELEAQLDELLRREPASVTISIRMPAELLERTKSVAAAGGVPYQALIKRLVAAGVSRLEKRTKP
ncbi:MAG TPA: CopG family antitoxin [Chloroflexota bacterium]|nr:CopG family antitoxin [Chloroflexota bacterium]